MNEHLIRAITTTIQQQTGKSYQIAFDRLDTESLSALFRLLRDLDYENQLKSSWTCRIHLVMADFAKISRARLTSLRSSASSFARFAAGAIRWAMHRNIGHPRT